MFVDSHCHLAFPELAGDIDGVLARMAAAGVGRVLSVCTRLDEFERIHSLALRDERVFASAGVHPDTVGVEEPTVSRLVDLATRPRVIAIGETGLDYYRLTEPLEWQRERFRVHIRAAREAGKPLIIHTRAASADTLRIMREERAAEAGGVMHCFTETLEVAQAAIEMGFFVSFSGIVTFRNARELQAVARALPLQRLLIETDAPYLAPVPFRGRTNEPAFVPHVAAKLAELQGTTIDAVETATSENFLLCFKLL
ncbi:MAG: TatD family hydrolase [Burkholderiales bacterium]|nr:MAG: TatD family hydrolase [Burkholderiales bacterium]